jgi:hypothetical protein
MARPLALLALPLVLLAGGVFAPEANADDEVLVLENGVVLRGTVVDETDRAVVIRLSGFGEDARVRVIRERIVRRFTSVEARRSRRDEADLPRDWSASAVPAESRPPLHLLTTPRGDADLPEEEPVREAEGFFHRMARVIVYSIPKDRATLVALGLLLFGALFALVSLGGRLAEIDSMGFSRTSLVALLLGVPLAADILFHETLLRADRATWVLPLQALAWMATAQWFLGCGLARATLLLSFVLFSLGVVIFSTGAVLMTF